MGLLNIRNVLLLLWCVSCFAAGAQDKLFEHFSTKQGMPDNRVYASVQGGDGQIWLATGSGVARFNGLTFRNYGERDGLSDREILGITKDANGTIWCFSGQGRIFFYQDYRFIAIKANEQLARKIGDRIINNMHVSPDGEIMITTVIGGGLYRVQRDSETVEDVTLPGAGDFSFFAQKLPDGGTISGSYRNTGGNNKLKVFVRDKVQEVSLSQKSGSNKSTFANLQNGTCLYAKDYELLNLDGSAVLSRAFVEKSVTNVMEDSYGKIWVALHQGGVLSFPKGGISTGRYVTYLADKSVTSILQDNTGNYWFTTAESGLYFLYNQPTPEYTENLVFSKTNEEGVEEVQSEITMEPEVFSTGPGSQRVIKVESNDTIAPIVDISGIRIAGHDTVVQPSFELSHDENYIKITYAGFSYSNPELVQYRYKMDGVDKDWIYTSNTFVQYTTLPPGQYRFRVNAMNNQGIWSTEPATVSFSIRPPYYRTWWFVTLCIVGGVLLVAGIIWLWLRNIQRKARERTEINKRIASVELQALRAQMNPHFIFNTLSSIQHFITTNDGEAALRYLSKFAKLMRKIMDNSKQSVIPVKDEVNALELYLELEAMRFRDKFRYQIKVDATVDQHYDAIPSMLIQPYVENAILHGFMNKTSPGNLSVKLAKNGTHLVCEIDDDGIGREASRQINGSKNSSHKSRGLSITQERLEILNASNSSDLSVEIIDKKDDQNQPAGTRVRIFVPVGSH